MELIAIVKRGARGSPRLSAGLREIAARGHRMGGDANNTEGGARDEIVALIFRDRLDITDAP